MKMEKFTLFCGLNDKDTKMQEISTLDAYKMVQNIALDMFDGATISEADGIYKHDDGSFTVEKTLRIELLFAEYEKVKVFCERLKTALNQESIAVQKEMIESELI